MYKLLLTTNATPVRDAFMALPWEDMGFRKPRIVETAEEAIDSLSRHHADAIAIGLDAGQENALLEKLMQTNPDLPVLTVCENPETLKSGVLELRKVLNRINADMSNTAFSTGEQLQVCRHEFFRAMMDRRIPGEEDIRRLLRLVRSKMDADKPCVVAELEMPADSDFLKGRWHYGAERLELALRNIFGVEVQGLRILSCVLQGDRIVLLGCPMLFHEAPAEGNEMVRIISDHVNDCIAHVDEFLGLDLSIASISVLPALTALAKDA